MARLGAHFRFFVRKKISEDPAWQRPTIIFSGKKRCVLFSGKKRCVLLVLLLLLTHVTGLQIRHVASIM